MLRKLLFAAALSASALAATVPGAASAHDYRGDGYDRYDRRDNGRWDRGHEWRERRWEDERRRHWQRQRWHRHHDRSYQRGYDWR